MTVATVMQDRIGLGIASMITGIAGMSVMDASAKWLGAGYPLAELVFFRNFFALAPILWIVWRAGGRATLRPVWRLGHVMRAACGLTAIFCFFAGLRYLPLAEAVSIAFAAPLLVTALSVPILGEHVGVRRWGAVIVGFLGVLIMTRPGAAAFRFEALLILAAAFAYALVMLLTRRLARSDTTPAIMFYSTVISLAVSGLLLPFGWRTPVGMDLAVFVLMGGVGGAGMFFMTQAYRHAPAAVVAPFDYTALIWGTLIGWLVWRELPDPTVWLGVLVVIASGLYIFHRETRLRRAAAR